MGNLGSLFSRPQESVGEGGLNHSNPIQHHSNTVAELSHLQPVSLSDLIELAQVHVLIYLVLIRSWCDSVKSSHAISFPWVRQSAGGSLPKQMLGGWYEGSND